MNSTFQAEWRQCAAIASAVAVAIAIAIAGSFGKG